MKKDERTTKEILESVEREALLTIERGLRNIQEFGPDYAPSVLAAVTAFEAIVKSVG